MTNQRLYVLLGRTGDILALLPCLKVDADKGNRPALMVSREYASVLDGVAYVDKVIFDGRPDEIARAVEEAHTISSDVVCCQVAGPKADVDDLTYKGTGSLCDAWDKEIWRCAGHTENIMELAPLVFDRRNAEREAKLVESLNLPERRGLILVSLGGTTSPFKASELLLEFIRARFRTKYILDLSTVKAERIYDLLALYERADCLVASDSAPLQLAWACPNLPVIALTQDEPNLWHGTSWKPNHACYMRYDEFLAHGLKVIETIAGLSTWQRKQDSILVSTKDYGHVFGRNSANILKDDRTYPYLKDVIRVACQKADWIWLTKPDVTVKDPPKTLGWCHRTVVDDGREEYSPHIDLFSFPRDWWIKNRNDCPDFILGNDLEWQYVLAKMIENSGGVELHDLCACPPPPPGQKYTEVPPRILHNRKLADGLPRLAVKKVSEQVSIVQYDTAKLFPGAYNCSLIKWNNRALLAYRYHETGNPASRIAMAEFDPQWNVIANQRVNIASNRAVEDPRLFEHEGKLWMSFVESNMPSRDAKCVMRYGLLAESPDWSLSEPMTLLFGKNDWSAMEKNHVFFSHESELMMIYRSDTEHVVLRVQGDKVLGEQRSATMGWKWGPVKGGSTPVPFNGELVTFFHSTLHNDPPPIPWRYYVGAMVFRAKPPFEPLGISRQPIVVGTEEGQFPPFWSGPPAPNPKVAIAYGAIEDQGVYYVSLGICDTAAVIAKLTKEDLHL